MLPEDTSFWELRALGVSSGDPTEVPLVPSVPVPPDKAATARAFTSARPHAADRPLPAGVAAAGLATLFGVPTSLASVDTSFCCEPALGVSDGVR
mmetsp:Transcript_62401/g.135564  ORF Transcript_62401/g.135564 Transcript_62401/m.135564 type:complete len:95 (+) Transcript_62401:137-421(+)